MNRQSGSSHSTILDPGRSWELEPGLAALAFGSRPPRRSSAATGVSAHLAFLPPDAIEIDLRDPAQRSFGDYELLELIGQGGMGVVYRARQNSLARDVAVKLLSAGPWASPDFIQRFQREAQSAARMQHPNIVPIHEIGAHEDLNFFSMRLVTGGSLAQKLAREGPMPPREAARLLRSVAEAVDYAHRLDVLHLDLKPGNVLLDDRGEPLVADFGLAKRLDETLAVDSTEVSGTPSYMAPEQAQVEAQCLSAATDIYGLGAILYECLVGRPPFTGASARETLRQVASDAPKPPRELQPAVPPDLEAICLKCLAKDPSRRYPGARALVDELTRFLEGRETRARPLNVAQRALRFGQREPKLVGLLALVLFSLAMGFGASAIQWQRAERNAADARHLLWEGRREAALKLEQDGEGFQALPRLLDNLVEQERAGDAGAAALERRRLGLLEANGAVLRDAIAVADANPLAVALSPGGRTLAVSFNDQSVRWYDTQTLVERGRIGLADRPSSDGEKRAILLLRFLDERRLLATGEWYENQANPAGSDSWLLDLQDRSVLEPPSAFADFTDAVFSGNGRYAVLRDRRGRGQLWQTRPWRALSAISGAQDVPGPWMVDPQGRFAVTLGVNMSTMHFHRAVAFDRPQDTALPHGAGISAWAMTRDGASIAIGDFEGRFLLLDTATLATRALPAGRGREAAWVAFSEDDAWLVGGKRDGSIDAFDVASGDSVSGGTLEAGFALQRVEVSHARRMIVASGEGRSALWRLGLPQPLSSPARRVGLAPAPHGMAARFAADWSPQSGLFASGGLDGQLRLWRLPRPAMAEARAASQVPEQFSVLGSAMVDVAWDQVRIMPIRGEPGRWLQLPQPPGFVELVDSGRVLALTLGPRLQFYDAASLQARGPAIALPESPERFATDERGRRIALVFGGNSPDGFQERLQVFDTRTGKRSPGESALAGPLRRLQFSHDASRLLAIGPPEGATQVLDAATLAPIADYPHDPYQPVVWADFDPDARGARLVTRAADPRLGGNSLVSWSFADDREASIALPGESPPLGVLSLGGGRSFVAATDTSWFAAAKLGPALKREGHEEATAALALSADGKLLAHARRGEVQLYDTASGLPLGAPLPGEGDAADLIARLAFVPDGSALLGRSLHGRWLRWPLSPETRPAAAVAADLQSLAMSREDPRVVKMPAASRRAAWRRRDPGPWPLAGARPAPSNERSTQRGAPIPARAAGTSPMLVNLAPNYDVGPDEVLSVFYNIRPSLRPLPTGLQRIGGEWFDIRGMVQVGFSHTPTSALKTDLHCVPLPEVPVAAVRPLLLVSTPHPVPTGTPLAELTLHFRDGGSTVLPLVAGRDVRGYSGDDLRVPLAFAGDSALTLLGLQDDVFSAPRLVNPQPARPVRCFDLRTLRLNFPLLLLATTLEPAQGNKPALASAEGARNRGADLPMYPAGTAKAAPIPGIHQGVSR